MLISLKRLCDTPKLEPRRERDDEMSRTAAVSEQEAWELEKKRKDAIVARVEMNHTIKYHFTDGGKTRSIETLSETPGLTATERLKPLKAKVGGSEEYEMKKKGLVPTGNWMTAVVEDAWDLPGGVGVHAFVEAHWDHVSRWCPVVASRQILQAGKHRFRVEIKRREANSLLARDGQIKIGFFESDLDPHENWMEPSKDHKAWYYRNIGNVYSGSRCAQSGTAPGFEPGDVVTATINVNDGTASFSKKRIVQRKDSTAEFETEPTTIQNDMLLQGVILLDYEELTAEDAILRADKWRELGLAHVLRGGGGAEYAEAAECFKKAVRHYHEAGDRAKRREASTMADEAELLVRSSGVGSGSSSPFRKIGIVPGSQKRGGKVLLPPPAMAEGR